jgi:hypothetical protein
VGRCELRFLSLSLTRGDPGRLVGARHPSGHGEFADKCPQESAADAARSSGDGASDRDLRLGGVAIAATFEHIPANPAADEMLNGIILFVSLIADKTASMYRS